MKNDPRGRFFCTVATFARARRFEQARVVSFVLFSALMMFVAEIRPVALALF